MYGCLRCLQSWEHQIGKKKIKKVGRYYGKLFYDLVIVVVLDRNLIELKLVGTQADENIKFKLIENPKFIPTCIEIPCMI